VQRLAAPTSDFYSREIEVCLNCKVIWETFDPAHLLDKDMPTTSSFLEPCSNCAFRPGSPEQKDAGAWCQLVEQLKRGASFYCHKGVPIDPASEDGFAYPQDANGNKLQHKLRLCRGYLNMLSRQWDKEIHGERK
jgi:hypothetical protein